MYPPRRVSKHFSDTREYFSAHVSHRRQENAARDRETGYVKIPPRSSNFVWQIVKMTHIRKSLEFEDRRRENFEIKE